MNNNYDCPRCGDNIVNNETICDTCKLPLKGILDNANMGSNIQIKSGMGKLYISRQKKIWGWAMNLTLTINGVVYKLDNGTSLEFDLLPGVYQISWKFWCRRKKTIQLNVYQGNYYCLDFKPDYFWGGFKLSNRCKFQ